MRRDLTNNYRKMHHLPKFRRAYIRKQFYKMGWSKHPIRRNESGELEYRLNVHIDETDAFIPFYRAASKWITRR